MISRRKEKKTSSIPWEGINSNGYISFSPKQHSHSLSYTGERKISKYFKEIDNDTNEALCIIMHPFAIRGTGMWGTGDRVLPQVWLTVGALGS